MARPRETASRPGWPLVCMGLLALSVLGIGVSLAGLARFGVDGSFALSTISLLALLVGIAGLQWWALLDVLRTSWPPEARILYVGLILLLVPVGAIVYYWLSDRPPPSPQSSSRD